MDVATIAAPGVQGYQAKIAAGQDPQTAAMNVARNYAGIKDDGTFGWDRLVASWGPFAAWQGIDFVFSKAGVWKRAGRRLGRLMS